MAAQEQNKQTGKINKKALLESSFWLLETSYRGLVGWILLSNFDHPVTIAVAVYSLGTGALIVVKNFVDAKK